MLFFAPLVMLVVAFRASNTQMPPAGLLRFQMQFGRGVLFYLTASLVLVVFGRVLISNSKVPREILPPFPAPSA